MNSNNKKNQFKYVFGPVPSRRLGMSLGVDVVPFKTCSFDCIYCECGKTTLKTKQRLPYVKPKKIYHELNCFFKNKIDPDQLDYITFSGGGEPTLNSHLDRIIDIIRKLAPSTKIALLTNSSLFNKEKVIQAATKCDLIIPSLDSAKQSTFCQLNRPVKDMKISESINGLKQLAGQIKNTKVKMWMEVFIVPGIKENNLLKENLLEINPEQIHLNILDRPGTDPTVKKTNSSALKKIQAGLKPLTTKIIGKTAKKSGTVEIETNIEDTIVSLLKRRPCTVDDISQITGKNRPMVSKYLRKLKNSGKIISQKSQEKNNIKRGVFYKSNE